jgi:hypothetical protein
VKRSSIRSGLVLAAGCLLAVPAIAAQQEAPAAARQVTSLPRSADQAKTRYQISVMEGVLERAVEQGARTLTRRVQAVMPDMLLWGGMARARGFKLEPYGLFFDVEVPALRRSVAWSLQVLNRGDLGVTDAIASLTKYVQSVPDPQARQQLEQALKRVELQLGPSPAPAGAPRTGPQIVNSATAEQERASATRSVLEDPGEAYTNDVKNALIDAMLDYRGLEISPDEWLTVAARDNEDRSRLGPTDPYDVVTITLRIRGSDLAALRAGRLTKDEARKRVELKEF